MNKACAPDLLGGFDARCQRQTIRARRVASGDRIGHNEAMAEADARATNAPEITVSELANALKRAIEDRFGYVRVRGEISGYRGRQSSGHAYFSLKDEIGRAHV